MEELPSRYSRPLTSRSIASFPETITIGSRLSQSRICVNGGQRYAWSSWASGCMARFKTADFQIEIGNGSHQLAHIRRRVRGADGQTQSGLPARHRWITDGRNKNALFAQSSRSFDGSGLVPDHQRNDGTANGRQNQAGGDQSVLELVNPRPKLVAAHLPFVGLNKMNRCCGGGGGGGNRRGGKNKGARPIHQVIDQNARAANVTAHGPQRLAERAHLNFDPVGNTKLFGQAAAFYAVESCRVGFVQHEPGAVLLLELKQFAQQGEVAIH